MRAIQMTEVKHLQLIETAKPAPGSDEVLLKIMAVGICGSDIPRILQFGSHVLPIIPGHEFAGEIVEIGSEVGGWEIGDRACAAPLLPCHECEWCQKGEFSLCEKYKYYGSRNDGAFAEYLAVKAENLVKLSQDTPFDWGATVDPAANAIHAFLRGDVTPEDSVCVFGLGAIGLFAIQYAKAMGIKTIVAVDIDDSKLENAVECGATFTVNSLKNDAVKAVLDHTNGKGVTVSFDMSGAPVAQHNAILVTGKMGSVVFLGISHKGLELSEQAVDNILRYQLAIKGSWNSFSNPFPGKEWTEAARLMGEKKLNPDLLISHKLLLEDVPDTFKKIDEKSIIFNKIMFYPNGFLK